MATVTVNTRRVMTDVAGVSERSGRGEAPAGGWKRHIVRELKHRDVTQHDMFRDLIRFYTRLLQKTSLTKGMLSCSVRQPSCDSSSSISSLLLQNDQLKKTIGEVRDTPATHLLAFQVVELQQQIKIKECVLEEQHARLGEEESQRVGALDVRQELQKRVEQVQEENGALKMEYDSLLERQRRAETSLREEKVKEGHLLEDMIRLKQQAAARMNSRNERRSRAREANLQKDLQTAARSKVTINSLFSTPTSRSTSPKNESTERGHARLFRSASATSPRILKSIKELFGKRRGHSVCSLEEDLLCPVGICLSARVPVRVLQVLEAHEQGINAVRFSCSSDLLATGGTDRVIKLWEVRAGSLTHRATLDGSTEGITSVEFDPTGLRILAASYDKSALLWRLDDPVPKVADVASYCSDLVCAENCIISGHYDSKIRVWDTRTVGCVQELPTQGKVTSLDISSDHRQLLSCCRDDCLQLVDLRRWSNGRMCFRADGFKCGSDSTKAVISPDGCFMAAGSADGAVYIWNVSNGNLETRLPDKHSSSISAVSWSLSGEYVVSVDKSRWAVLWSDI
ncbi:hypothetical protein PAMP_018044 [Pampus punctatissimus]